MRIGFFAFILVIVLLSCFSQEANNQTAINQENYSFICETCSTIETRFAPPNGFKKIEVESFSFATYLRNLPLKPINEKVRYFDGRIKGNQNVYLSVIAMDIDAQDLQQCADAVMRLKGEYHYHKKEYEKIHFNFLSDGKPRFYKDYVNGDYSYKKFRKYMRYIFSYANTASLYDEMEKVSFDSMKIGDVFIQKRNPYGHAVIVVDMAENTVTGGKIFMLAQSYMPAQETQILVNPNHSSLSPWYELKTGEIRTPEWTFTSDDLRRFKE
ncbi:MAG: DUF4846 domain-containing protein [Salinivirgaceae bacterium]|nr:DUF4846 domain-containing protein [Salinivirgaceae bacterium]